MQNFSMVYRSLPRGLFGRKSTRWLNDGCVLIACQRATKIGHQSKVDKRRFKTKADLIITPVMSAVLNGSRKQILKEQQRREAEARRAEIAADNNKFISKPDKRKKSRWSLAAVAAALGFGGKQ